MALDDSTLYTTQSPFLIPYNRIIDAAGQSVSFGDASQENHSLDAVLLPDKKRSLLKITLAGFEQALALLVDDLNYLDASRRFYTLATFSVSRIVSEWR